jgi:hypothetical protein
MKPHSPDRPEDATKKAAPEDKAAVTLPGTVEKIIPPIDPRGPEKAQIGVHGADDLYREIRVENVLKDPKGHDVILKPGAEVDVTIEAAPSATQPKKPPKPSPPQESKDGHKG